MKFLHRAYFALLYALPAILFFSYYPIIRLGSNTSMNFELSLPLLWLVLFDLTAFISLIALRGKSLVFLRISAGHDRGRDARHPQRRADATAFLKDASDLPQNGISDRKFFLLALFPLYATLSIFWSANPVRGILTAGIIWLIFFAVFAIVYLTPLLKPAHNFRPIFLKSFLISSAVICIFCWLQCILDASGVTREHTLLCVGCVSQTFGFPHPSGFAIEPQFMGNLLLAPTLLSLWILMEWQRQGTTLFSRGSEVTTRKSGATLRRQASRTRLEKIRVVPVAGLTFLFSTTLFLTFSRGAIYAFVIALAVLLISAIVQHKFRPALVIIPVAAFIFTLTAQGIFSVVGPTHEAFASGVTKSIHQLSLGIIDLRPPATAIPEDTDQTLQGSATEHPAEDSKFDGYIAESTDIRLNLNSIAIQTWFAAPGANLRTFRVGHDCPHDSPFNDTCASYTEISYNRHSILFGVGLGGAGSAMHAAFPEQITTPKEIVQNQPLSLLLELGLVGITLLVFSLLVIFLPQLFSPKFINGRSATNQRANSNFWQHPALPLLLSLIVAYVITLQFFSGLPNALQIYLLPPALYLVLSSSEKTIALSK